MATCTTLEVTSVRRPRQMLVAQRRPTRLDAASALCIGGLAARA